MLQKSVPAWFEIPARDFDRALPLTALPEGMGVFAQIRDTEGTATSGSTGWTR